MTAKFNRSHDQVRSILKTKLYKVKSWNVYYELQYNRYVLFDCFNCIYLLQNTDWRTEKKHFGIYRNKSYETDFIVIILIMA